MDDDKKMIDKNELSTCFLKKELYFCSVLCNKNEWRWWYFFLPNSHS